MSSDSGSENESEERRNGRLLRVGGLWVRFFSGREDESSDNLEIEVLGSADGSEQQEETNEENEASSDEDSETFHEVKSGSELDEEPELCPLKKLKTVIPHLGGSDIAKEIRKNVSCSDELLHYSKTGSGVNNLVNCLSILQGREMGIPARCLSASEMCHISQRFLPLEKPKPVDRMNSRAYIGQFTEDGSLFVAGFQDSRIRLYEVEKGWRLRKDVIARSLRWTITDTALTPDQRFLIYSSISPVVHLVNVGTSQPEIQSLANVTDVHEALDFSGAAQGDSNDHFGVWSIAFSGDGKEILGGSNSHCLHVYDLESNRAVLQVPAHEDDVNSVCYLGHDSSLLCSGGDDNLIKVWDRRTLSSSGCLPVGVLVGHVEGITHLNSKGDGRYIISNSKDQTLRLWDLRTMRTFPEYQGLRQVRLPRYRWDYRWMEYPGRHRSLSHPHDQSIMVYRGHQVYQTLIRAYFSPAHSTAQRYIYTGSSDGKIYIYDLLTGVLMASLACHKAPVRDCSWHPFQPSLVSTAWDGHVLCWGRSPGFEPNNVKDAMGQVRPVGDAISWDD